MKSLSFMEKLSLAYHFFTKITPTMIFPYKSPEEIRAYQFERIKSILIEAYEHVPFYRKLYDKSGVDVYSIQSLEEFSQKIPCIVKSDIINHTDEFINDKYQKESLTLSRSSGTSGVFVDLYADASVYIKIEIQVIRMIKEIYKKYSPFDKEVLVYTSEYPVSSILGMYRSYYVNNLENSDRIFNFIIEKKPTVLAVYPSILREIINNIDYDYKSLGIKLIITNSEASSQLERDYFSRVFNCDVIDEFSSEEIQSIAYQCKEHNYHEVADCSFIEVLEYDSNAPVPDGQIGELTGTSLLNYAMPMIRYRHGDSVVKSGQTCPCGKNTPVFSRLEGRCNSSFVKKNGKSIPSGKLLDWSYSLVLNKNYRVQEFQIVQDSLTDISIYLVAKQLSHEEKEDIISYFQTFFGTDLNVTLHIVDTISKTSSGKHIPIYSKI